MDSAEYAQQNLKIAREQLEISKQTLRAHQAGGETASYVELTSKSVEFPTKASGEDRTANYADETASEMSARPEGIIQHNGQTIEVTKHGFIVNGRLYGTLEKAKEYVEITEALPNPATSPSSKQVPLSVSADPLSAEPPKLYKYRGQKIEERADRFFWKHVPFANLDDAKTHLDNLAQFGSLPSDGDEEGQRNAQA